MFECKTMNTKGFKQLKAKGVQEAKPIYWSQMQVGMHLCDLDRALFVTVCKETDEIYMERVRLDKAEAVKLVAKAGQVVFAEEPPAKLNEDPSFYLCKFCSYAPVCHDGNLPEVNCRTCAHVTPEADGTWSCRNGYGEVAKQGGCNDHLFNPSMMPWTVDDAGSDWVDYVTQDGEVVSNAGNSREMHAEANG